MPDLTTLAIGDDPKAWAEAGFEVENGSTTLGSIGVNLGGDRQRIEMGLSGWTPLDSAQTDIDGLPARPVDSKRLAARPEHPNRVVRLDHVVIITPDLGRTITGLEVAGFEVRRSREIPGSDPGRRQVFLWAGEAILEVIGPTEPTGDEPASLWGLALTTEDLERAAEVLGPNLSQPKPAVQPGRHIATVRTNDLGITPALALMTPHVRVTQSREQSDPAGD